MSPTQEITAARKLTILTAMSITAAPYIYLALAFMTFLGLAATFLALVDYGVVGDTYIVLIYAWNLADGAGLVYSDGTRVEGYTDPLWVLLGAAAFKLGIDPLLVFRVVGIGSGLGLLAAVWVWNRRISSVPQAFQIAPFLVAAIGPVAYWAIGGLETTTFAALAFTGTLLAVKPRSNLGLSGGIFFVAALTHPDAVVLFAPVLAYVLLREGRRDMFGGLTLLLSFALPFTIYWLARWAYFGEFMPNTFHAKSTFSWHAPIQALFYLLQFSAAGVMLMPVVLGLALRRGLNRNPEIKLLLAQLVLWLVYLAHTGGDFMPLFRFLVPVAPILAILLQESVWIIWRMTNWRAPVMVFSGLVIATTTLGWVGNAGMQGALASYAERQEAVNQLGMWMAENSAETDVIAVSAAGAIPYFSQRPTIDMLGINDKHIARSGQIDHSGVVGHKKYDAVYVLDRNPQFIVLNLIEEKGQSVFGPQFDSGGRRLANLKSNEALLEHPVFWANYSRVLIPQLQLHPVLFVRDDRAKQLAADGTVVYSPVKESMP